MYKLHAACLPLQYMMGMLRASNQAELLWNRATETALPLFLSAEKVTEVYVHMAQLNFAQAAVFPSGSCQSWSAFHDVEGSRDAQFRLSSSAFIRGHYTEALASAFGGEPLPVPPLSCPLIWSPQSSVGC